MPLPFGLRLKNKLNLHEKFHTLLNTIHELIMEIPNVREDLRGDPELVLLVARLVENYIPKNTLQLDKKDLCLSVLDKVFDLTDDEKESIGTQIQFLYDHDKIKKCSSIKLFLHYLGSWISRKYL